MIYGIGLDSGNHGAVGLVSHTGKRGTLPTAIGAWGIWGKWPGLWYERALEAARYSICPFISDDIPRPGPRTWEGHPARPIVWQETSRANLSRNPATWMGFGKRCGALLCAFHEATGIWPEEKQNSDWREQWNLPGKGDDPEQRIRQCAMYIQGSKAVLAGVRPSCQIDAAEALLVGGAAVMAEVARL